MLRPAHWTDSHAKLSLFKENTKNFMENKTPVVSQFVEMKRLR